MRLFDSLKKLIPKAPGAAGASVLGVDVSSSTIKVVQLKRKHGKAVLETYGELALGPYAGVEPGKSTSLPAQKIGEALADLMKEAKVTTKSCGVAIPLASSLINVIEMPDVGERRLKEMVPIELRKYIPVNISEVLIDWHVIPSVVDQEPTAADTTRKVEILTVAIHRDTMARFQEIIKVAGLSASFYEIEAFSIIRAVLADELAPTMIIDLGAGTTKVFIVDRRVLRESHVINRGSQDITLALSRSQGISVARAEELKKTMGVSPNATDRTVAEVVSLVLDSILAEAHRVMLAYERRYSRNVGTVILSGGGIVIPGLIEKAKGVFQTSVTNGDPFAKVEAPAFLEDVLATVGPEFAVALGVALRKLEEIS